MKTSADCKIVLDEEAQLTASACTAEDQDEVIVTGRVTQGPTGNDYKTQCIVTPMDNSVRIHNSNTMEEGTYTRER